MQKEFYIGNRKRLYEKMEEGSLLVLFSGKEKRKTNDEYYPFYTDRNFLYLTGIDSKEAILLVKKENRNTITEQLYILPPNMLVERWSGARIKEDEAQNISGIENICYIKEFERNFHGYISSGKFEFLYLDLFKVDYEEEDKESHKFFRKTVTGYPNVLLKDISPLIRKLRLIKQACEIDAMRKAEKITCAGIMAMMKNSRPGMYEYQYKAEFDYILGQFGPQGPAFPSIISAGNNNFCIHYYSYNGQAKDGDMILNDVGAWYDNIMTDVSRAFPCNGKFSQRQKLLYDCALKTSNHMFDIISPGMKMSDVDLTIKKYNCEMLKEAGVLKSYDEIGTYMWHGGAHHVGFDVHDAVETPEIIEPGMVFCVDVGIYHEEWGIGFRLEDNCLVTEQGCENLSSFIPRTIEEIEENMIKRES